MKRFCTALLLAALGAPLLADNGRDFAGRYDLKDPVESTQGVSLTVLTDLQNVSGAAKSGVTFELEAQGQSPISLGPVDLADAATVRFAIPVTVDSPTFQQWSAGGFRLAALWTDAEGQPQRRAVELMRAPLANEVQ